MSDILNQDQEKNELKFNKNSVGAGEFVFSINNSTNEMIMGEDNLIKIILIDKLVERENKGNKDVEKEINCILYENNKIFYNQEEKLYMSDYFSLDNTCLLTTLSSKISKILYNNKFNYVICYDEDDNIHIVDINTKNVNQYKSENKCSIKTGIISKNEQFLILLGIDGQLTVYEFNKLEQKNTALNIKNIIRNFLPKNVLESKKWNGIFDTNNKNILISGGESLLKIVDLNDKELKANSSTDFTCLDDISYTKFINDEVIMIIDIRNNIKIYHYLNKKLIMKLDASKENEEHPFQNLDFLIHEEDKNLIVEIIYGDNGGNLFISDKINISEKNMENLDEKVMDELFGELDEENKDKKEKKDEENDLSSDKKSKKSDEKMDQADLSILEDSEGNLLGKDEIERKLKEKQENALKEEAINNVKNIDIDTLKEKLGIMDIQEPFMSGSTSGMDNVKIRYILCNLIGTIIYKENNGVKTITINFSDISNKRNISFINTEDYIIGAMNEIGLLLGNHIEEENLDAYEKEDRRKTSSLLFKPILNKTMNLMLDWKKDLPQDENPVLLAIGSDWCCAYTSMSFLRIYSIFGSEKITLSLSNTVIAITGYENYLAYVYISSLPLSNSQQLRFKILDEYKMFNEVYDGILSISPLSNLIYFSYSKEGILISYDSYNIVRGFFYEVQNNWVPLLDLGNKYINENKNFWCIGVEDNEIYGIEMKGEKIEPYPESRPVEKTWNLITDDPENEFQKSYFFISFEEKRCIKYNEIRKIREDNILFPDYKLTETLKEDSEIKKQKIAHDKKIINKMKNLAVDGQDSQVIVLFDYIFKNKNKEIFIKICRELDKNELADYLSYKLNISQIIQKQNFNNGGTIIQYVQEPTTLKKKKNNDDEKSENNNKIKEENEMSSFAFDVDAYQKNMNEMKKDLKKEGFIGDNKKQEKKEMSLENISKEESDNLIQNNSLFKNANVEQKEKEGKRKELFSDLKKVASTSPIKEPRKSADVKPNQAVQKKGKKRTHKEVGEMEKRPKKSTK
jgi:hypothetical protein